MPKWIRSRSDKGLDSLLPSAASIFSRERPALPPTAALMSVQNEQPLRTATRIHGAAESQPEHALNHSYQDSCLASFKGSAGGNPVFELLPQDEPSGGGST